MDNFLSLLKNNFLYIFKCFDFLFDNFIRILSFQEQQRITNLNNTDINLFFRFELEKIFKLILKLFYVNDYEELLKYNIENPLKLSDIQYLNLETREVNYVDDHLRISTAYSNLIEEIIIFINKIILKNVIEKKLNNNNLNDLIDLDLKIYLNSLIILFSI